MKYYSKSIQDVLSLGNQRKHLDKLQQAHDVMKIAHEGQYRNDGITPYYKHPETVVKTLEKLGVTDENVLCAGYLHDVLEDTKYSSDRIRENFGDKVLSIVNELTFKSDVTDEEYLEKCNEMSIDAKWVKVADILSNLGDTGEKSSHFVLKRVAALKILLQKLNMNQNK